MYHTRLSFFGLGNVAKSLLRLLLDKRAELARQYGAAIELTGVSTRRFGYRLLPADFPLERLLASPELLAQMPLASNLPEWLAQAKPTVAFELASLNPHTGQPAIDHIRAALQAGAHVVTANKGPVLHGYQELRELAARQKKQFLFEATCLAGVPFFSLFRETRPLCRLVEFRGIVNVTANLVLRFMEEGLTFEQGVQRTQAMGLAETDPSHDVDGWDAAVKIAIVANVLMGGKLKLEDVTREGIRGITPEHLSAARARGKCVRLVVRASRKDDCVRASVGPEELALAPEPDLLAAVGADGLIGHCTTDTQPPFTVAAHGITPFSTASDVLADFIHILRQP